MDDFRCLSQNEIFDLSVPTIGFEPKKDRHDVTK